MKTILLPLSLCLLAAAERPAIRSQGVVNAASHSPEGAGGAVARGSLISIHGVGFGSDVKALSVRLTTGGGEVGLPVLRANSTRIEAWIPARIPLGAARLVVGVGGQRSEPARFTVRASALGLYSANGFGWGPARSANTGGRPVAPGKAVTLVATGFAAGQTPLVTLGGRPARVLSSTAGPDRTIKIDVEVPPDAPEGCFVPVLGRTPDGPFSNTVTIAVSRTGGACRRPPEDVLAGWTPGRTAFFRLSRTLGPVEGQVEDRVSAGFSDVPESRVTANPLLMAPPPGTCTAYGTNLDPDTPGAASTGELLLDALNGQPLNAGPLLRVDNGYAQLRMMSMAGADNMFVRTLRARIPSASTEAIFVLDQGWFHIAGTGGKDVGRFKVDIPAPAPFSWTNRSLLTTLNRSKELSITWSGAAPTNWMMVSLWAANPTKNESGLIYCLASAKAGRLSIPAGLLAVLPSGRGEIRIASGPTGLAAGRFQGVDHVVLLSAYVHVGEFEIPQRENVHAK